MLFVSGWLGHPWGSCGGDRSLGALILEAHLSSFSCRHRAMVNIVPPIIIITTPKYHLLKVVHRHTSPTQRHLTQSSNTESSKSRYYQSHCHGCTGRTTIPSMRDRSLRCTIQSSHRWGNPGGDWRGVKFRKNPKKNEGLVVGKWWKLIDSFVVQLMSLRKTCIGYEKNMLRARAPMATPPNLLSPKIVSNTF